MVSMLSSHGGHRNIDSKCLSRIGRSNVTSSAPPKSQDLTNFSTNMATKNLPALVRDRFSQAQKTGDLTYYPTQLALLQCNGLPVSSTPDHTRQLLTHPPQFQIRFSPALAKKPKSDKSANTNKPFDPFEDPPQALRITQLRPSHYLVLNMFPVIPDHFLLLTTAFKEQTHLLEEDDLEAAYACIGAYKEEGEELFGFYNSGEHSGASQPHRHIQFLPVESMRIGLGEGENWSPLVDRLAEENAAGSLQSDHIGVELTFSRNAFQILFRNRSSNANGCIPP